MLRHDRDEVHGGIVADLQISLPLSLPMTSTLAISSSGSAVASTQCDRETDVVGYRFHTQSVCVPSHLNNPSLEAW